LDNRELLLASAIHLHGASLSLCLCFPHFRFLCIGDLANLQSLNHAGMMMEQSRDTFLPTTDHFPFHELDDNGCEDFGDLFRTEPVCKFVEGAPVWYLVANLTLNLLLLLLQLESNELVTGFPWRNLTRSRMLSMLRRYITQEKSHEDC
jgi:hypothetical protein